MQGDGGPNGEKGGDDASTPHQPDPPQDPPKNGGHEAGAGRRQRDEKPSQFDQSLRLTDVFITIFAGLSFVAAGVSAAVAMWTAGQLEESSKQTERAIGKLATLADQTKRQADAQNGQLVLLGQQVAEAKSQTKAISEQTTAIKSSAIAAVKSAGAEIESAQAQTRAADAAAAAERPSIVLTDMTMTGFDNPPETDGLLKGLIKITFNYQYTNVGGSPLEFIDNAQNIAIDKALNPIPDYSAVTHLPGNGLTVPKGSYIHLVEPLQFGFTSEEIKGISNGTLHVYVFGAITYSVFGANHKFCYAYELPITKGASGRYLKAGSAAYHCDT